MLRSFMIESTVFRAFLVLTAAGALATSAAAQTRAAPLPSGSTAAQLRDRALADPLAYSLVESLTTEIGPRPAGSPAAARARDWGVAKLKSLGFTNVHAEAFAKPSWTRGPESAEITAPYPQKLAILGLGGSVPTPPGGIEAEAVVFRSLAELLAQPVGSLNGKIAIVTQKMTRTQDGSGYSAAVRARGIGASEAARRGAVAFLLRSVSTAENRSPHTGAISYQPDAPRIPAAAVSPADAELIDHMADRRQPIRVRLSLASTTNPNTQAWNVVGEIRGRERPEEVVVVGGHLDAWDPGTGAIDDGAGIAISTAAAKLIGDLPRHPRRTVRVVMWGSEETGGSGQAYADAHKTELPKIVLAGESDLGSDRIWSVRLPQGSGSHPAFSALASLLAPLKIFIDPAPARFGGSDTEEMQVGGVPVVDFNQEATRYFDVHHSADDTLDRIDPEQLNQNVAAWAAFLYLVADSDIDFRTLAAAAPAGAAAR
jgi:Zn-dependent M28 family amino/carboxypeptidase